MHLDHYSAYNPADIEKLFIETFTESADASEGALIGQLVHDILHNTAEQDKNGFVATDKESNTLIGSILFTRLTMDVIGLNTWLLAPVAVATAHQRQGVGQRLIRYGLEKLNDACEDLVVTYGNPAYYSKVGFEPVSEAELAAPYPLSQPEGWQWQFLEGSKQWSAWMLLPVRLHCVPAFNHPDYW